MKCMYKHDWESMYPDFDTPFPVRQVLVCTKCKRAKDGGWVTREDGVIKKSEASGMGCGTFRER